MCPVSTGSQSIEYLEWAPQEFQILVPRERQIHWWPWIRGYKQASPASILFEDQAWDAWSLLAQPALRDAKAIRPPSTMAARKTEMSRLELMPTELLAMVLGSSSLKRKDIIALGLCSEVLWTHVLRHAEKDTRTAAAPWAGAEIACTGTRLTDFPEPFANLDLAKSLVDESEVGRVCSTGERSARDVYLAALKHFDIPSEDPENDWRLALDVLHTAQNNIPKPRLCKMSDELLSMTSRMPFSSLIAPWILRNLTTKEYVRCCPRSESGKRQGYVDDPEVNRLRIDDILVMRIFWTTRRPRPRMKHNEIYRGQWAGHCFDIVELREENLATGDEWKDVTKSVVQEAQKLYGRYCSSEEGRRHSQAIEEGWVKRKRQCPFITVP
ncbi:hypothetical protein MMC28_009055 [Mycoblastus sanguinarius]|nr:hypothetical protein [Mycoblastus sanguinarius]